jgi:hypothetical protein
MKCGNCGTDVRILFNVKVESASKEKPYRNDICWVCCAILSTMDTRN